MYTIFRYFQVHKEKIFHFFAIPPKKKTMNENDIVHLNTILFYFLPIVIFRFLHIIENVRRRAYHE